MSVLEFNGVDVFADVLDSVRIRGRVFCRGEFSAPWSIGFPSAAIAHFHIIERGSCWLAFEGETDPIGLAVDDVVLIAPGRDYHLSDHPTTPPVALARLIGKSRGGAHTILRLSGQGPQTDLICGAFEFRSDYARSLWSVLPPFIRLNARGEHRSEWLDATVKLLRSEIRERNEGTAAVVTRLTEIVFAQAIRAWLRSQPDGTAGWLGALRDPAVGTALRLMHQAPERQWTVLKLATEVAMSRSLFAARFTSLVGAPPVAYLTRWRMQIALDHLRNPSFSLAGVAKRVGYGSVAAFSRAFKDEHGVSPGAFRRSASAA